MNKSKRDVAFKLLACGVCLFLVCIIVLKGCGDEGSYDEHAEYPVVTLIPDREEGELEQLEEIENAGRLESDVVYINQVLSYEYSRGNTISVGTNIDDNDNLYINPACSVATDEDPIGYYILADQGYLLYADQNFDEPGMGVNDSEINLLLGRTYDQCMPARYIDNQRYGVLWHNDTGEGAYLYIRAIRISDGAILANCRLVIEYDAVSKVYSAAALGDADVQYTGELSFDERELLVNDAIDFLRNNERGPRRVFAEDDWEVVFRGTVVEHVPMTYYNELLDVTGGLCYRRDYIGCEVFAVSMPVLGYGHITVYYAPILQLQGLETPYSPGSQELDLIVFGYDAFYPFTQQSLEIDLS